MISTMEHTFNEANFQIEVLHSPIPVLIDFWAEWCGPCRMMSPIVEQLAQEIDPTKMKVGKLNVDESSSVAGQFNVMSIPTFLIFKEGKVVDQLVGTMSKEAMKERIEKWV